MPRDKMPHKEKQPRTKCHCFNLREKNADTFENTRQDSQLLPTDNINRLYWAYLY